jgi:peptide/nickel transport system permease protein
LAIVQALVAAFGVLTIVFFIMRLSGDPTLLLVPEGATAEQIAALRHALGFDRPLLVQYGAYLADLSRLDLGESLVQRAGVAGIVAERIPYTVELAVGALLIALGIGVPAGVVMAVWRGGIVERALAGLVLAGQSLATFWSGILLILLFGVAMGWLPTSGADSLQSLIMPSIALGALSMSTFARMTRIAVLDELSRDYVMAARARGLSLRAAVLRIKAPIGVGHLAKQSIMVRIASSLRAVLLDLLLAHAADRPLCILVEDTQWIDPTTVSPRLPGLLAAPAILTATLRPVWEHRPAV